VTSTKSPAVAGVLPVFQTPYLSDETIDFATLQREIEWLYERGADGIVMAMVSEVLRLSSEEREQLAAAVCRFGRDRGSVVISVGAEASILAERYARQAEGVGAHAVMAIPPVAIAALTGDVLRYYERIIKAVRIPVIVQDASGYVGRPMPVDLLVRLLNEFGDRILFKPEATPIGPRLSELRDAVARSGSGASCSGGNPFPPASTRESFPANASCATSGSSAGVFPTRVFEGSGGIALVDSYRRGIVGTMPGADLIDGIVALWRALQAGDEKRVYALSLPISSLVALQTGLDGFLAVEKYLLVKQGVFRNTVVRGPRNFELDDETRLEVDRLFDRVMDAVRS
jgi:4-hydroxy-tetrahydrodipicolinate synthase